MSSHASSTSEDRERQRLIGHGLRPRLRRDAVGVWGSPSLGTTEYGPRPTPRNPALARPNPRRGASLISSPLGAGTGVALRRLVATQEALCCTEGRRTTERVAKPEITPADPSCRRKNMSEATLEYVVGSLVRVAPGSAAACIRCEAT